MPAPLKVQCGRHGLSPPRVPTASPTTQLLRGYHTSQHVVSPSSHPAMAEMPTSCPQHNLAPHPDAQRSALLVSCYPLTVSQSALPVQSCRASPQPGLPNPVFGALTPGPWSWALHGHPAGGGVSPVSPLYHPLCLLASHSGPFLLTSGARLCDCRSTAHMWCDQKIWQTSKLKNMYYNK